MKAYINASGIISPQYTCASDKFPDQINEVVSNRLSCIEPEYRSIINPLQLRRMPRILKMGLAAAQLCVNRSGGIHPDGIVAGTGLGCLGNLEKFLKEVLETNEHVTSVLDFINSTHNAVASGIAMLLKNHNYNATYCHRAFSFESALQDAMMLIEEDKAAHVLAGGIDECTDDLIQIYGYLNFLKKPLSNLQLLAGTSTGTIAGEGSAFFMLSEKPADGNHNVWIDSVYTFYSPSQLQPEGIQKEIDAFLLRIGMSRSSVEGVIFGLNGDVSGDELYYSIQNHYFSNDIDCMYYKHLCGEYYSSGAFALWLGLTVLKYGNIPEIVRLKSVKSMPLHNILIYNHYKQTEHSLIFLRNG
jgi:3-oxoacyl-[acyl-carrier-protein] synthase II